MSVRPTLHEVKESGEPALSEVEGTCAGVCSHSPHPELAGAGPADRLPHPPVRIARKPVLKCTRNRVPE